MTGAVPFDLALHDDDLSGLPGNTIRSSHQTGVRYRVGARLAAGGMAVTFLALRHAPEGQCPVVLKLMRPSLVRSFGGQASTAACKEAVSLGRLNEQVPCTPYVVRLVDAGALEATQQSWALEVPWLALEYVHGGAEGTTLLDRVRLCMRETGAAFDTARAAHAVDCLTRGLEAVHAVGVIHRDIKPANVLCCGFGDEEIFKIADFGVARPLGVAATFDGGVVGTPGYAPPEVVDESATAVGPWTDVFGLAAVVFFLLTGEDYFQVRSVGDALVRILSAERRGLLDAARLAPDLRARPLACKALDAVFAQATSPKAEVRPQSAAMLAAAVLPHLRCESWRQRPVHRPRDSSLRPVPARWTWTVRQHPCADRVARSIAWDGDGTCLMATSGGLAFWDGTHLREAPAEGIGDPAGVRFVRRLGPRKWLLACDEPLFAIYTEQGVTEVARFPEDRIWVELFHGDIDDLAVAVGRKAGDELVLLALSGRRWLKPLPLPRAAAVMSVARIDDARWLVVGRSRAGGGFAGLYSPLEWELEPLSVRPTRALLACAGDPGLQVGLVGGADGTLLWHDRDGIVDESTNSGDISAVSVEAAGGGWAAGAGRIMRRRAGARGTRWESVWEAGDWRAPIVSLFADVGVVFATTADAGILEGRSG
jgi:serine/threonine protein kinase